MSKVSMEQACEVFRQIAEGMLSGEAVQELIERGWELALSQIRKRIVDQTYIDARMLADLNQRTAALLDIAIANKHNLELVEVYGLIENLEDPDMDFAAMAGLMENPDFNQRCAQQIMRIKNPYQRALRAAEFVPFYYGTHPDADDLLDMAKGASDEIDDENKQDTVRKAIAVAYAKDQRIALARSATDGIKSSYFKAGAYTEIYRMSKDEEDLKEAMSSLKLIKNYWGDMVRRELAIVHSELGDFGKAWEMACKIEMKDWLPGALVAIIKAAVEAGNKTSVNKAMHTLSEDRYRWWRTQGHLLIAAGEKKRNGGVKKEYLVRVRRSIMLCQDAGHRAEAFAGLAAVTRDPNDLESAYNELKSIKVPADKFKTSIAILKAF